MEAARLVTRHQVTQYLHHFGSFSLGVLPPTLSQRPKVPNAEDLKWTRDVRFEDHFMSSLIRRSTTMEG